MEIDHIGVWVKDLEGMRRFYENSLGGRAGALYRNPAKKFSSYFVRFETGGAAVELMHRGDAGGGAPGVAFGYAHVAFGMGTRASVDEVTARLRRYGFRLLGGPRVTGDGCYESTFADPEGNRLEFAAPAGA